MNIKNVLMNLKAVPAGGFPFPAATFWFVALALVAPVLLLTLGGRESNNLPWYIWTIALLLLLMVISFGFLMFTREARDAESISISPDRF